MRRCLPLVTLLCLLVMPASASAVGLPSTWDKGFNFTAWWHDGYATANAQTSLDKLATTGANSIALFPVWYQASPTATTIARDASRTPTDASIATSVQRAKAKGLRVLLRPTVNSLSGGYRGNFAPSNPDAWFASYRAMINHYAELARSLGIEGFSVGTELESMTNPIYDAQWRSIIADVRARFPGWLTYSSGNDEFKHVTFWGVLDRIGIDAYWSLSTGGGTPTEDQVVAAWTSFTNTYGQTRRYVDDIAAVQARVGKPVIFTEVGYASRVNALVDPWNKGGTYSAADQQVALAGFFRAFAGRPWFRGAYIWHWYAQDPNTGGTGNTDHTPQNKPAQTTITSWFTAPSTDGSTTTPTPVNQAPTVRLDSPTAGQLFRYRLDMRATASDDKAVTKVEFRVNGVLRNTDTVAPYAFTWSVPKKLSYGTHTVVATAYDAQGLTARAERSVVRSLSATS